MIGLGVPGIFYLYAGIKEWVVKGLRTIVACETSEQVFCFNYLHAWGSENVAESTHKARQWFVFQTWLSSGTRLGDMLCDFNFLSKSLWRDKRVMSWLNSCKMLVFPIRLVWPRLFQSLERLSGNIRNTVVVTVGVYASCCKFIDPHARVHVQYQIWVIPQIEILTNGQE